MCLVLKGDLLGWREVANVAPQDMVLQSVFHLIFLLMTLTPRVIVC